MTVIQRTAKMVLAILRLTNMMMGMCHNQTLMLNSTDGITNPKNCKYQNRLGLLKLLPGVIDKQRRHEF